jgi:single-strand DNA-binding protein
VNKVILEGHLGQDPEMRHTQNGHAMLKMRLATSEKGSGGKTHTAWHTVVCWGHLAEDLQGGLSKGDRVHVEGRISYRSWETKDGEKRYATDIVASSVSLLDKQRSEKPSSARDWSEGDGFGDEEIPF